MSMQPKEKSKVTLESSESVIFRSLFEVLKDMLVEGNLIFTKQGIQLRSKAVNHLTHLYLSADKIDKYYCREDLVVGVNFEELHQAVKSLTQDDTIGIQITDTGYADAEIHIYIMNDEIKWTQRRACSILSLQEQVQELPERTFNMSVSIPSVLFQRIVRCHRTGKTLQILAHRGNGHSFVYFYTPSDMNNDTTRLICSHSNSIKGRKVDKEMVCKTVEKSADKRENYSLSYLQTIAKSSGMSKKIRLFLRPGLPLVVRADVGSMGQLTFVLASNCETEDTKVLTLEELLNEDPDVQADRDWKGNDIEKQQQSDSDDENQSGMVLDMATKNISGKSKTTKRRKRTKKEAVDDDDDDEKPKKKKQKPWRKKRLPKEHDDDDEEEQPSKRKGKTDDMYKRIVEQMDKVDQNEVSERLVAEENYEYDEDDE